MKTPPPPQDCDAWLVGRVQPVYNQTTPIHVVLSSQLMRTVGTSYELMNSIEPICLGSQTVTKPAPPPRRHRDAPKGNAPCWLSKGVLSLHWVQQTNNWMMKVTRRTSDTTQTHPWVIPRKYLSIYALQNHPTTPRLDTRKSPTCPPNSSHSSKTLSLIQK